jgi:hypothetical protein
MLKTIVVEDGDENHVLYVIPVKRSEEPESIIKFYRFRVKHGMTTYLF